MDITAVILFAIATLLPVVACVALSSLQQRAALSNVSSTRWQILVGVIFGVIAIFATETGVPANDAVISVSDAAPLAAGLFFGGPAGIIAGVIAGVERLLASMWGVGEFTRIAGSLALVIAGVYAALLRRYLFDERIPSWSMALATGIVAVVLHLMLVFVINFKDVADAFAVVQACALPMIVCVGISTALSALALALLSKQPLVVPRESRGVAQIMQNRLLIAVIAAFFITVGFTSILQSNLSRSDTESLLRLNIEDVKQDIGDASDANLLSLTRRAAGTIGTVADATNEECVRLADELDIAEIHVIDGNGIIVATNVPEFIGFDMNSGEQSKAFLVLLPSAGQQELVQSYQPIAYDANKLRKYAGVAIENGFVQVGYDGQNFFDDISTQVEAAVMNRHVGQTGELIVVDEEESIISTRDDVTDQEASSLVADLTSSAPGSMFTTTFCGNECYASYGEKEGYRIIALLPVAEANYSRDVSVLIMEFMEVLVFAALFLVIYFTIKRIVVRSIWQVNGRLGEITKGDLDVRVDVRESSEFASLSDDINQTVGALKESIAVVQSDLEMAADIQANSMPSITPAIRDRKEFELFACMEPAKEVGGDFYDFFMIDYDHLGLVVADVSGKGVPAALFMMQSKTTLKMEALSGFDPDEVLLRTNDDLSEKNENDMFTTAWLGVLELSSGRLTYADAGHEKLAIYRDGVWELPPKPNRAVALASFGREDYAELPEKYRFRNHTIVLAPGDAVLQYTDGVTEATNVDDELFGEERLLQALNEAPSADPAELLPFVREKIAEFIEDAPQFDDLTMLGLLYKGPEG